MPEMQAGDIIVQGTFHALMWVDAPKPIVHNANKGQFHGVLQQSLRGALQGAKQQPHEYFGSARPDTNVVYRCDIPELAATAASFAIGWATESGSPAAASALETRGGRLKTPYSDDRMVYAEYDAKPHEREWSVAAMYRALRAYARFEEALTPKKGSSCSQFITYCYQAASIRRMVGELNIPPQTLQLLKQGGAFLKLSNAQHERHSPNLIELADRASKVFAAKALPMVVTDAKMVYVGSLLERLNANGSGFTRAGYLVPNLELTAARLAPIGIGAGFGAENTKNWSIALRSVGYGD